MKKLLLALTFLTGVFAVNAQKAAWKSGILVDDFIYDTAAFPQCHSATIEETTQGMVAAFFGGTREGHPDVEIYLSHYKKGIWSKPKSVANGILSDTLRKACYNPVLFQVENGPLLLFYKIGNRVSDWKGYMKRSTDGGYTWGPQENLPEGYLGPIKNKPFMINGELYCPSSTEVGGWKFHFEITPDLGKTWRRIGPINDGKEILCIQPSILFHKKGVLQVLGRTRNRQIAQAWSQDNGRTWGPVTLTDMPNNNSGTDAVTLKDGRHLLVYNHVRVPDSIPNPKGPRTPLNLAISKDGKNWEAALVLENSPISQYSYPTIMQAKDGKVHIVYTWRRLSVKHVIIDVNELKTKKIKNGQWPGGNNVVGVVTLDP